MTYKRIALFPFVWAALFALAIGTIAPEHRANAYILEGALSKGLAALGCFAAAYAFEEGDYMRKAWSMNGWCYLLLLVRDVTLRGFGLRALWLTIVLVVAANASSIVGTWLVARAWAIAGLELPGSRLSRGAVMAGAAAIAFAVVGSDFIADTTTFLRGDWTTLHSVVSDLGDIIGLLLLAPVLLTAIAMRGGVLKWPWGLLTASLLFWLFYDGVSNIERFVPDHPTTMKMIRETCRAVACVCECAAGLAQRRVITRPPDGAATE